LYGKAKIDDDVHAPTAPAAIRGSQTVLLSNHW
jgi:hypothetical protein